MIEYLRHAKAEVSQYCPVIVLVNLIFQNLLKGSQSNSACMNRKKLPGQCAQNSGFKVDRSIMVI